MRTITGGHVVILKINVNRKYAIDGLSCFMWEPGCI